MTPELTIQPGIRLNYDKKEGFYNRVVTTGAGVVISCSPAPAAGTHSRKPATAETKHSRLPDDVGLGRWHTARTGFRQSQ